MFWIKLHFWRCTRVPGYFQTNPRTFWGTVWAHPIYDGFKIPLAQHIKVSSCLFICMVFLHHILVCLWFSGQTIIFHFKSHPQFCLVRSLRVILFNDVGWIIVIVVHRHLSTSLCLVWSPLLLVISIIISLSIYIYHKTSVFQGFQWFSCVSFPSFMIKKNHSVAISGT